MPPRARSPSPPNNDEPLANRPRQHRFNPAFNDEDSDIIIWTSDGWSFALKRVHLQANSQTFADMLVVANEEPRGRGIEHLPVVDITEKGKETYLFLRHLVSSKYLIHSTPPSFLFIVPSKVDFLTMCEKYDTPSIRSVVLQLHFILVKHSRNRLRSLSDWPWPTESSS